MPRVARIVSPGIAHHVTQRGNRGQDIFLDDEDRKRYLVLLKRYAPREGLSVQAYCLMSNHLHLIVTPNHLKSLSSVMQVVHTRYAQHVNDKYDWTGHVFASRYYACGLDDEHLWAAMRYVECNPVRAGLVKRPEDWLWSSAAVHAGKGREPLLDKRIMNDWTPATWRKWLRGSDPDSDENLRAATWKGRPLGNSAFVRKLERMLGRRLRPRPRGRPREEGSGQEK